MKFEIQLQKWALTYLGNEEKEGLEKLAFQKEIDIEKKRRMRCGSGGKIKVFSTWKVVGNKGSPWWVWAGYVG